jgi:esterase/lipase superfamily enzyme
MRASGERLAAAAVAAALLAGCGDRPRGVLGPVVGAPQGGSRVDMLVATTRAALPDRPGEMFSGERGAALAFADLSISIPPDAVRAIGDVQWPSRIPGDPAREFVALRSETIDLAAAYRRFNARLPQARGRVVVFVHGFNNRFEDAVMRFAQIMHDSRAPGVPVLFTWPSRGRLLAYPYDRESANYSRDALEAVLARIAGDPKVTEIGILAHSMGNWVTMEALRTMALRTGRIHPKIRDVMLAAPDVDVDVFGKQVEALGPRRPRMTLFVSQDDRALGFSQTLWGDVPRLGAVDPRQSPYDRVVRAAGLQVVDLTGLKSGDPLAHGVFAESPAIVRFIGRRLADGQVINEQRGTITERVVQAASDAGAGLGGIAARVVSAPVTILEGDPDARDASAGETSPPRPDASPAPRRGR